MTHAYGLRNLDTGRIARLSTPSWDDGEHPCRYLSYDVEDGYWKTDSVASLVETIVDVDRALDKGTASVPATTGFDLARCQPIVFIVEEEFGEAGGDPIRRSEYIRSFELDPIHDFRGDASRTTDIDKVDAARLGSLFSRFDRDRVADQALAILHFDAETGSPAFEVGVTHQKGPAEIVAYVAVPKWWPLNEEQRKNPDRIALVLLDARELGRSLDFDQFDVDHARTVRS